MTESQIQAARALVASPHFRWVPRMATTNRETVLTVDKDFDGKPSYRLYGAQTVMDAGVWHAFTPWPSDMAIRIPDLNDPATLGCVEYLAGVACGDPCTFAAPSHPGSGDRLWFVYHGDGSGPFGIGPSKGEALVAAILAAPVKP